MSRHLRSVAAIFCLSGSAVMAHAQPGQAEFAARRSALATRIGEGALIAFGGRTPVTDFGPFYQLSSFHYVTGFDEPDAAFVMVVHGGKPVSTLYLSPIDPRTAFYYGRRPDSASVSRDLGVEARSFGALAAVADSLASSGTSIYTLADFSDADFARQDSLTRGRMFVRSLVASHPNLVTHDAHPFVDELRARKSDAEIALLRRAAEISSEGHRAVLMLPRPSHEYEMQSALEGTFLRLGGARPAYGSIVGSGRNGTQLHYMRDRGPAMPGDLVVIDAATEYEG
ncbi:MAG: aminopeptidase P N-terminal domain-containing protein, partial [Gemmatimonadota bacterium]|nr:aminopeptidase P N-terminal domain-containing protein [Gemmatimonadota bacterium]